MAVNAKGVFFGRKRAAADVDASAAGRWRPRGARPYRHLLPARHDPRARGHAYGVGKAAVVYRLVKSPATMALLHFVMSRW